VSIYTHKTASGGDYYAINPKGNVPAIVLEDGTLLNEGAATLQWIADQAPESGLAPAAGTTARYVTINWLNYLSSELHASYGPLFGKLSDEAKAAQKAKVQTKLAYVVSMLKGQEFLQGHFTIADAYCYIILSWSGYVGVDVPSELQAYSARIAALPFVVEAHAAMATAPHPA